MRFLLASVIVCLLGPTAHADWVDDFTAGNDQGWTFNSLLEGTAFSVNFDSADGGSVEIRSDDASAGVGGPGAIGVFGLHPELFTSPALTVTGRVNPNAQSLTRNIGLLAYANPTDQTAYALTADLLGDIDDDNTPDGFFLSISRVEGTAIDTLETTYVAGLDPLAAYDLDFTARNGELSGNMYDTDGNLLLTVNASDNSGATLNSGLAGIVAQRNLEDPTLLGTFGSASATAVPEPGMVGVLASLGLGCMGYGWRRRRIARQR